MKTRNATPLIAAVFGFLLVLGAFTSAGAQMIVKTTAEAKCTIAQDGKPFDGFIEPGIGDGHAIHLAKFPLDIKRPITVTCDKDGFKERSVTLWSGPQYWAPEEAPCSPPPDMTKAERETYCLNYFAAQATYYDPKHPSLGYPNAILFLERKEGK
jgi:hypothetical protein